MAIGLGEIQLSLLKNYASPICLIELYNDYRQKWTTQRAAASFLLKSWLLVANHVGEFCNNYDNYDRDRPLIMIINKTKSDILICNNFNFCFIKAKDLLRVIIAQ